MILAEGLPAETYLETGHRTAFANGGVVVEAYPTFVPEPRDALLHWDARGYGPLMVTGAAVRRARLRLVRPGLGQNRRA